MDENISNNEAMENAEKTAQQPPAGSGGQQPEKKAWSGRKLSTVIVSAVAIFAIGFAGGIAANAVFQTGRNISARIMDREAVARGYDRDSEQTLPGEDRRSDEGFDEFGEDGGGRQDEPRHKSGRGAFGGQADGDSVPDSGQYYEPDADEYEPDTEGIGGSGAPFSEENMERQQG